MRVMRLSVLGIVLLVYALLSGGCGSIRVTDTPRTATEQFLVSQAAIQAVEQLSLANLRDAAVFVEPKYINPVESRERLAQPDPLFVLGELRARLLLAGVRLVEVRDQADIVVEVRAGSLGVDKSNMLIGLPEIQIPGLTSSSGNVPVVLPEIAIVKNIKQYGYASIAIVAYRNKTGELVAASGPFVGRTNREDWWLLGYGPRTSGNVPAAQRQ